MNFDKQMKHIIRNGRLLGETVRRWKVHKEFKETIVRAYELGREMWIFELSTRNIQHIIKYQDVEQYRKLRARIVSRNW